jgi:hypothetical protein
MRAPDALIVLIRRDSPSMTETSKIRCGVLIFLSLTLFLLCSLLSLHDLFFLGLMFENGATMLFRSW